MQDNNAAGRSGSPGVLQPRPGGARREVRPERRPRGPLMVADVDPTTPQAASERRGWEAMADRPSVVFAANDDHKIRSLSNDWWLPAAHAGPRPAAYQSAIADLVIGDECKWCHSSTPLPQQIELWPII
jgi:hypothetical protein